MEFPDWVQVTKYTIILSLTLLTLFGLGGQFLPPSPEDFAKYLKNSLENLYKTL